MIIGVLGPEEPFLENDASVQKFIEFFEETGDDKKSSNPLQNNRLLQNSDDLKRQKQKDRLDESSQSLVTLPTVATYNLSVE